LRIFAYVSCRGLQADTLSDAALLSRFAAIEGRIDTLEEHLSRSEESRPIDALAQPQSVPPAVSTSFKRIPEFHHGAGHKVLQYWSRLRVHLTIPNVNVLQFLKNAEDQDQKFTKNLPPDTSQVVLSWSLAKDCLHCWNDITSHIPIGFSVLLESSIFFSNEHISSMLDSLSAYGQNNVSGGPQLGKLALEDLLIYTIGLRWLLDEDADMPNICFTLALQHLWRVQMEADEVAIPYLLVVAHIFLYTYNMPSHALGILQIVDAAINRLSVHRNSR
jgi:hypothetical protein